ncbi:MerR family transcriptional regulator [Mycobacterium sp. B14F4]|uniref:MerR family transcriptional regulator n=1 Tax=Mycobacterium sp. B14F4 TaxID=3153565 RepID=UPI00325D769D
MTEYRLDELARISGVSARNIRAYRERGLLDPPRRVGRSAFYDDYHLSQLRTINQLHRRGFNSAHIAEFFTSLRQGADLADILGIQRAVLGPRTESADESAEVDSTVGNPAIDADSNEGRRLVAYGMAEVADGSVTLTDLAVRNVIARAADPMAYVRVLLHIVESTRDAVDVLAGGFVHGLDECVAARFGVDHAPGPDQVEELSEVVRDYRELWNSVVSGRLDTALQQQVAAADSEYAAGALLSGRRESEAT